ncbi:uncharacterized protein LOC134771886 [Penaeus indicus]|uniref:uncharacterized protein LOC134771886 n=1 Tax=Penaeus indicus TaxID=29960 RepID=UPI00300C2A10
MNSWRIIICLLFIAQRVSSGEIYTNVSGGVVTSEVCVDMAERYIIPDERISTAKIRYSSVELKKLRYKCGVIGVSETWFSRNKPAELYMLPGYELIHKDRETRGGGVALYVKYELALRNTNIFVPDNLECVWTMIEQNFPYHVKKLFVCCLYHPPNAPSHDELLEHLVTTVDAVRSTYSDTRIVILGDCNDLDVNYLTTQLRLRCIVTTPTHGNSTIDLILTDAEFYINSETQPPIGLSRHLCVVSRPDVQPEQSTYSVRTFRPFLDSSVRQFGQWITHEEWRDVLATSDADEAADTMERVLLERYEACFPERRQRMRKENKPWITARILRLMDARRRAYDRGNLDRWRELYRQIKWEIKNTKRQVGLNIQQNDISSPKFSMNVKGILGGQKKPLKIPVLSHLTNIEICNTIKSHFTNICTHLPPIDPLQIPSFLPACEPPVIDRITVYKALLSLKANKASPPGSLPKKLLHEFAYEISEPFTHVIKLSIESGIFPRRWKGATITPLAKKRTVNELGDLRPLSLTPDFGKILEGFVAQLVLQDIRPNLDPKQYGNLKGKSPSHYLTSFLDTILKALDKPKKIAQIVLIDFKKAFDLVRYQDTLSDWDSITCGVPQGTRLGPVIFLAIIDRLCRNTDMRAKYVDDLTLAEIVDVNNETHFTMPNLLNELSEGCAYAKNDPKSNEMRTPVWHPGLKQAQHTRLERIQKRCLRIILSPNYVDYNDALNQLRCDSLYQRREDLTLRFGKSLLESNEFRHLLPQYLHEIHVYECYDSARTPLIEIKTSMF